MRISHLRDLVVVLQLHLAHFLLHVEHLLLLLLVGLLEHLGLGDFGLVRLLTRLDLLSIAQLVSFRGGLIRWLTWRFLPIVIAWLLLVIYGLLIPTVATLVVEMRCRVLHLQRIVHVVLLLELLRGGQIARVMLVPALLIFHYHL